MQRFKHKALQKANPDERLFIGKERLSVFFIVFFLDFQDWFPILVFQGLQRSRDTAAAVDKHAVFLLIDRHNRAAAQQSAKIENVADFLADGRNDAYSGRFRVGPGDGGVRRGHAGQHGRAKNLTQYRSVCISSCSSSNAAPATVPPVPHASIAHPPQTAADRSSIIFFYTTQGQNRTIATLARPVSTALSLPHSGKARKGTSAQTPHARRVFFVTGQVISPPRCA